MIRMGDLKNFLTSSDAKTFSEGARRLGISQPALSESVKRLESDLQSRLFYRTKGGVTLTPEGRRASEMAASIFALLSELESRSQTAATLLPVITIGCHAVVGSFVLPRALAGLHASEPRYRVSLKHDFSRNIQIDIQRGVVDVGIVVNAIPHPDLIVKKVARDDVAVWQAKTRLVHDKLICDPDLFQTQSILRKWKNIPHGMITSSNLELICRLTSEGLGVGIIPQRVVTLLHAPLEKVSSAPEFRDEIFILHRPEFGKTPYEKNILKSLSESLAMN